MATVKVTLIKGLKIKDEKNGDITHIEAEIREATAGDFIDATEESERLCMTPDGDYVLVASPTLVGVNTLKRQIVCIGEYPGPLTLGELKKLSVSDINLLQAAAQNLETASLAGISARGRGDAAQR